MALSEADVMLGLAAPLPWEMAFDVCVAVMFF